MKNNENLFIILLLIPLLQTSNALNSYICSLSACGNIQNISFPFQLKHDPKHIFVPKISDFGLAKFYSTEKKAVTLTAAKGTIGFVAPKLIKRGFGRVSYKADVYSFGMLMIEMVCLKKDSIGNSEDLASISHIEYMATLIKVEALKFGEIDEKNEEDENGDTMRIAHKMTIVTLWCIQMSPNVRSSMSKVLVMLKSEVEYLQIHQRPTQSTKVVLDENQSWSTYSTDSTSILALS
ncbi:hypothetical protein ACS0TY_036167 [Phlomoides rotata]